MFLSVCLRRCSLDPLVLVIFFLPHNFLTCALWWLPSHLYTVVPGHAPVVSRWNTHPAVARLLIAVFSLSLLLPSRCISLRTDQLWHYASWSFTLRTVSLRLRPTGFSDTLSNALFQVRLYRSYERYSKAKIQIFNFWQMQIPKKSLFPVCLFSPFCPAACVLRDKPSTGFSPSLSNSKA